MNTHDSIDYSKSCWFEDEGFYDTIGIINTSPDSKWCHISFFLINLLCFLHSYSCNGVIDVVIARKGNCFDESEETIKGKRAEGYGTENSRSFGSLFLPG